MQLNVRAIEALKPKPKKYRQADGHGLALLVHPNGSKYWQQRFRRPTSGKAAEISLGTYPLVSLKEARERSLEARKLLEQGLDPSVTRKTALLTRGSGNTFQGIAEEFVEIKLQAHLSGKNRGGWVPKHAKRQRERLENYVYPWIGDRPIQDIKHPEIYALLRRLEKRGVYETAHRVKYLIGQIFRHAVFVGSAEYDPTTNLRDALITHEVSHHPAITEPGRLGELLRSLEDYNGNFAVACALRLAPLVFVRPNELANAKWADIYPDTADWRYVSSKNHRDLIVPLSRQAREIIEELRPVTARRSEFLFPSVRTPKRAISDGTLNSGLRRLGWASEEVTHQGYRATARTMLDERLNFRPEWIEMQLDHAVKDSNGHAYNRTTFLEQRIEMMQRWADYLDELKGGR